MSREEVLYEIDYYHNPGRTSFGATLQTTRMMARNKEVACNEMRLDPAVVAIVSCVEVKEEEIKMPKRSITVSKPQFDLSEVPVGRALTLLFSNKTVRNSYAVECLIVEATPLYIKVAYVSQEPPEGFRFDDHMETHMVYIDQFVRGEVEISPMIVDTTIKE